MLLRKQNKKLICNSTKIEVQSQQSLRFETKLIKHHENK
jgi:hypothetical protein